MIESAGPMLRNMCQVGQGGAFQENHGIIQVTNLELVVTHVIMN